MTNKERLQKIDSDLQLLIDKANALPGGGDGGDDMAGALADKTITEFYSNGCTAIGEYSFRSCKNLKTLVAPNAKSVGTYAFYGCSALKSIVLPSVTTATTNSFREASNLEVIDLPKLTAVPTNAFYGCRGLKTLILRSETVVTLASTNAFTQCYRILGTKNSGYNPTGEKIGFIYVPKALIEDYKVATNWSDDSLVTQFRAIEDYSVDGTLTGEIDPNKPQGYTATINCNWDEEYGSWLMYSTDKGDTWHDVTEDTVVLSGVRTIRFDWEPDDWAECDVFYGGEYDEELGEYVGGTYVERNTDVTLTEDTVFKTNWAP